MARTVSWQSDLVSIHRRVSESPRSPYHREDLEKLFRLGERATQTLMELMPRMQMANLQVVERQALLDFLAGALDAEDLRDHLTQLRKNPPKPTRRKLRMAVPRDFEPGNLQSLKRYNVWLERGKVSIDFTSLDDLMSKVYQLITVVEDPMFERRYCERPVADVLTPEAQQTAQDRRRVVAETRALHKISSLEEAARRLEVATMEDSPVLQQICDALNAEATASIDQLHALDETAAAAADLLRGKLASLFLPASSPSLQTSSPALSFPPAAAPSPHPARVDKFAL